VLLGALALLAGQRADKGRIRHGSDELELEAVLHLPDTARADALLGELGLPACEDGQLIIHRMVSHTKVARITVNGRITTQANLAALGDLWLDVHGRENQVPFQGTPPARPDDSFARKGTP
jgi:DNA repair protein RecN (Recombination protein N)